MQIIQGNAQICRGIVLKEKMYKKYVGITRCGCVAICLLLHWSFYKKQLQMKKKNIICNTSEKLFLPTWEKPPQMWQNYICIYFFTHMVDNYYKSLFKMSNK